jgi:hypothetical protein
MINYLFLLLLFKEFILLFCFININVDTTGLLIPYTIGALGYIKSNLCLNNYQLTGISGGSFASVIYHYENDLSNHDEIWNKIIGDDKYVIKFNKNLDEFQQIVNEDKIDEIFREAINPIIKIYLIFLEIFIYINNNLINIHLFIKSHKI